MGIYLSSPDTRKNIFNGSGNGLKFGGSSMQGWRLNQEDDHISEASFTANSSLFAIFDGHGGTEVSKFCGKYFGPTLKKHPSFANESNIQQALIDTFMEMDILLLDPKNRTELLSMKNEPDGTESMAGCTANVLLIHRNMMYCANAGDSRSILFGAEKRVIALSEDHKPENKLEEQRITKAGGFIINGRVNGNLNLSRALGDLEYKKNASIPQKDQLISAYPDIEKREIRKDDKFVVMGCDGIWEILTMEEICKMTDVGMDKLGQGKLSNLGDAILDAGLAPDTGNGVGCDNMSAIVIK